MAQAEPAKLISRNSYHSLIVVLPLLGIVFSLSRPGLLVRVLLRLDLYLMARVMGAYCGFVWWGWITNLVGIGHGTVSLLRRGQPYRHTARSGS